MFQLSIQENGELKDIKDCEEGTVRAWLDWRTTKYLIELVIMLLQELREKNKEER